MINKGQTLYIMPLAVMVFAAVAFAFFVWLSINQNNNETNNNQVNAGNKNSYDLVAKNDKSNNNTNKNINQATAECVKSGCSGQVCAKAGDQVITTCEILDWHSCLALTVCERQSDGSCGWTKNNEFIECMQQKNPSYLQNN